jgi:hypothetical protein
MEQAITNALLNLEEKGLIDYDEENDSFEPTVVGLKPVNGIPLWLVELRKLASPGKVYMESN